MLFRGRVYLRCALAGCLVVVALAGCQFHRTGHGFVLRSQWSLECDPAPRLTVGPQKDLEHQLSSESAKRSLEKKAATQPEVLPWRTRLKARLAGRLFPRNGSAGSAAQVQAGAPPDGEWATAQSSLPPPPKEPDDDALDSVRPSARHELPASAVPTSERRSRNLAGE